MLKLRTLLFAGALVATLAASFLNLPGTDAGVSPQTSYTPVPHTAVVRPDTPVVQMSSGVRAPFQKSVTNLFAPKDWQPPSRPTAKAPPPSAPPLPFRYLGKSIEQGEMTVFVSHGATTLLLRRGDVLSNYRIEDITPTEMTLVYLPLNEQQRLPFGSAN